MIRKILYLFLLLPLVACQKDEPAAPDPGKLQDGRANVRFVPQASLDLETEIRPMKGTTRATEPIRLRVYNVYRCLILKKIDSRWVVDTLVRAFLRPPSSQDYRDQEYEDFNLTGELPDQGFEVQLRPGDYKVVTVLNYHATEWNNALRPGTVVADESAPDFPVPFLVQYWFETDPYQGARGYRVTTREVFAGSRDFTVDKTGDLHTDAGADKVVIPLLRRTAKFRPLLKYYDGERWMNFRQTQYLAKYTCLATTEAPFCEGVNALGGPYYRPGGLHELPVYMNISSAWRESPTAPGQWYHIPLVDATAFNIYFFTDPDVPTPYRIEGIHIYGREGDIPFYLPDAIERTFAYNSIEGIVLTPSGNMLKDGGEIELREVTEEKATEVFPAFYENYGISEPDKPEDQ